MSPAERRRPPPGLRHSDLRNPRGLLRRREAAEVHPLPFHLDHRVKVVPDPPDARLTGGLRKQRPMGALLAAISFAQVRPAVVAAVTIDMRDVPAWQRARHPEPGQPVQQVPLTVDGDLQKPARIVRRPGHTTLPRTTSEGEYPDLGIIVQDLAQALLGQHRSSPVRGIICLYDRRRDPSAGMEKNVATSGDQTVAGAAWQPEDLTAADTAGMV